MALTFCNKKSKVVCFSALGVYAHLDGSMVNPEPACDLSESARMALQCDADLLDQKLQACAKRIR